MSYRIPDGTYTYSRVYGYGPNTQIKALILDGSVAALVEGWAEGEPLRLATLERVAEANDLVLSEIADRMACGACEFQPLLRSGLGGAA